MTKEPARRFNGVRKRVLSGMRPTGKLHLGHLVGALTNWVKLQDKYETFYMVADLHALLSEYEDTTHLEEYIFDNVIDWLACGLDPDKSTIFVQSHIKEHVELYFLLSTITSLSWLERCPTYKEQLQELRSKDITTYGFLGYPVLQAADILLYKAQYVPVGKDQLPHLELAREIVRRFNSLFKSRVFIEPEPLLTQTPKLLGIDNRKMSKSYDNAINISDSPDVVRKKVMTMITDEARIRLADLGHPEVCNVYTYFEVFAKEKKKEVENWCSSASKGCTECKKILVDILIERLKPIQEKRNRLAGQKEKIEGILSDGASQACQIAGATMREVKKDIRL